MYDLNILRMSNDEYFRFATTDRARTYCREIRYGGFVEKNINNSLPASFVYIYKARKNKSPILP